MTCIKRVRACTAHAVRMRHATLDVIHEEHQALAAMRRSLGLLFPKLLQRRPGLAFASHRDPLTGFEAEPDYRPLFRQILNSAPAPIGLGPAR